MSLNCNNDDAESYNPSGATAYLIDPAGTYSNAGASAPTTDPPGTYSDPGTSASTPADAGTYIPLSWATSEATEIVYPAGGAVASAATIDPAGFYSGAGLSAPPPASAGTYFSVAGVTSSGAEIISPARAYALAGANAPKTDPAGAHSGAGLSAPTPAAATYIPGARATSSSAKIVDASGTYSGASRSAPTSHPAGGTTSASAEIADPARGFSPRAASARPPNQAATSGDLSASAPALNPKGAPPGYYYQAGATAYVKDPAGTYSLAGATTPTADPAGTYSAAGASAPTTDTAGTYSSPYELNRLFLLWQNTTPDNTVLSFNSATAVANYYGATSEEASLAKEFFAGYSGTSATMLFTRYGYKRRPHLLGANISNLTLNQLQGISGSLAITLQGYTYSGSINLSGVTSFSDAAGKITRALNHNLQVAAVTAGSSIAPVSVSFMGSLNQAFLQVTSVSSGSIELGALISGPGVPAGSQIVTQLNGTPGGAGLYSLYVTGGNVSSETMTETYGVLAVGAVTSGAVAVGQEVTGAGVLPLTAIDGHLSGSGPGSTWLVDNAQTVTGENMTMTAPPLSVLLDWNDEPIIGATANNDFFNVAPNGDFGYDNNPSSLSYMGGTAAAALGLTQEAGANDLSPGGQNLSASEFMNNLVQNETGRFGSFQSNGAPGLAQGLAAWAQSTDFYQFSTSTTTTPPAGSSAPTTDPAGTYSGRGASAPTPAAAGTYIPVTGATSAAAEIVDFAGTYSLAGATTPIADPAGTYSLAGASAPTADPAGTYSGAGASAPTLAAAGTYILDAAASSFGLDRLFLEYNPEIPFNEVLSFKSVTAVENFFGVSSAEATLASDFFSEDSGSSAHMLFDRMPLGGGRARIYGANISGLTLAQLQAISGTLSLTLEGYNFKASVNLASATSFASAASLIQSALNAAQPTVATTTGSSIARASASFTGSIEGGLMVVTAVSSGQIAIGGILTSANGYSGHIVSQDSGTPGGVGVYNVWYGAPGNDVIAPPGTALSETYGILTVGTVNSGTVAVGQEVTGSGITANTALQANISGSGGGSKWVVDLTQTVASEAVAMKAAPFEVDYDPVAGATVNFDSFWIEANLNYPLPSTTMTYASGTAAASLGLTQSAGAHLSTSGQITTSPSAWLNNIVNNENSDWASFQMTYPTASDTDNALSAWSAASGGQFQYLSGDPVTTPPIVPSSSAAEIVDPAGTYSGPGASLPTLAAPGTYIPVAGATSAAAAIEDAAGSYSLAGASTPTLAQPGYYVPTSGASSETRDDPGYYTPDPGATAEIKALPPTISGTLAGQSTAPGQPDTPFSSVTITDPNIETSDSLSIKLTGAGGTLADGAGFTGLTASAPGVYLLSGTAAAINSELDALVFTPSAGSGTTTFTLTDTTNVGTSASNANTTVTVESSGVAVGSATMFQNSEASVAYGLSTPGSSAIDAIFAANPIVQAAFGSSADVYATGEIGGGHASAGTDPETLSANVPINVNPANLGHNEELMLGFANGDLLGAAGVTAASLTVSDGGQQLIDQNLATPTAAQSYSDDNIASGLLLLSPGGTATTLNIGLTVQTDRAGSGLYGDFIVGGAPEAAVRQQQI